MKTAMIIYFTLNLFLWVVVTIFSVKRQHFESVGAFIIFTIGCICYGSLVFIGGLINEGLETILNIPKEDDKTE